MTPFGLGVTAIAAYNVARHIDVAVEHPERFPRHGPVLLAPRHYHHLWDGCALVWGLPRQTHVFVALDWTASPWERLLMETVCNLADFPIALRADNLNSGASAFSREEIRRYVRRSIAKGADLLRRGQVLTVFPEGYPTIDPHGARKNADGWLPFRAGVLAVAAAAQRDGGPAVPILPVGLRYEPAGARTRVTVVLGEALRLGANRAALLAELETRVRELSR